MDSNRLKLRISPCPNDTFMFDAMIHSRIDTEGLSFDVEFYDIEELNAGALAGGCDITKISTALLPALGSRYELLDSGSALGRGNGPLMVRRKGDTAPIRRIAVPGLHTTADALVGRLFPEIGERVPMLFCDIAAAVERGEFDAGVLIHEGRFVYARRNLDLVADLGQEWERRTGLPLPLGSIVASTSLSGDMRRRIERVLARSIEYAFGHPAASREFVREHAQELDDDVIDRHIDLFVNDFSVSLSQQGRHAVEALTGMKCV